MPITDINKVRLFIDDDSLTDATITQAIDDGKRHIDSLGYIEEADVNYELLHRMATAHFLHYAGKLKNISSVTINNVSYDVDSMKDEVHGTVFAKYINTYFANELGYYSVI